ncbi:hypothetical protein CLAFUW4_11938 [Fulvia fulva]|uniref:Uncharacterized protein n=1 Tax=Passalora fulva TaxID=5499 RepID=A0A9Q8PER6_PASFU|nr:uncharacterized protein CLAFUR5_10981 [Fulvia fulva]KAK4617634.1 hypothetical protein CLAFUR4_11943 [Fulvia fulva]KAK4618555.1 hypothetical protein CLAFUR0_11954 [Fulvia fulva]UJO21109.1 hypothetical protein CLAFUR5_10981 [Fulvia fulva]WPV17979.1 hypothetical protein CLAFUW4_11938 [Fulvia fulva]WPV33398.1 hypothetical protein CLAFUW7_11945 [Fulvia fulva]
MASQGVLDRKVTTNAENQADLENHYEQRLQDIRSERSRYGIREYGSYITACNRSTCTQNHRWARSDLKRACRANILVYIIPHESEREGVQRLNARVRARAAVAMESFRASPDSVLSHRAYFMECRWSEDVYPDHDLEHHLDKLIADHLRLCDWLESESDRTAEKHRAAEPDAPEWNGVVPSMRAVFMIFWPDDRYCNEATGRAALVLTGDDSGMKSGPITLDGLSADRLPGYGSHDRIVHLPLAKAVGFLAHINEREVAANEALRARDEYYIASTRDECLEEARERLTLSKTDQISDRADSTIRNAKSRQRWRQIFSEEGFSERHAMLAAMSLA